MFAVYENGQRCSSFTFDTKRDAEVFAYFWAYPVSKVEATLSAPQMKLGYQYNYSQDTETFFMCVQEVIQ